MARINTDNSPTTSVGSLPSPMSDDEFSNLSDSWMEVETSSIGPSTFDGLSDSSFDSNDHDSRSEASSFDSASNDGREIHSEPEDVEAMSEVEGETPSLISGSYDLASSKLDGSKMGSSVDTIQQYSTSSSQVRLIFPDPGSSFSAATAGSHSGLLSGQSPASSIFAPKRPRSRGQSTTESDERLQESILSNASAKRRSSSPLKSESRERSSKLWSLDKGEYWLLDSTEKLGEMEKMKESKTVVDEPEALFTVKAAETEKDIVRELETRSKKNAILTVCAMLALGVAGLYTGYSASMSRPSAGPSVLPVQAPTDMARHNFWDRLSASILTPSATEAPHIPDSTNPVKKTEEYRLIKQALSTLNEAQHKAHSVFHTTPPPSAQSKSAGGQDNSLAVRNENVALMTLELTRKEVMVHKLLQKVVSASRPARSNIASAAVNCTCDLSTYYSTQILPQIMGSYTRTKALALSAYDTLMRFFFKEVEEVFDVGRQMFQASDAAASLVVSRATRGARILHTNLTPYLHLPSLFTSQGASNVTHEALDALSEYVESTMEGLVGTIGQETRDMQDKAEKSIRKAKKGLNRVIKEKRLEKERKVGKEKSLVNAVDRKGRDLADPRSLCVKNGGCFKKFKGTQQQP
ncbi:hypothetical protein L198_01030 [Cryptococcus wingfieldii CBS 7118]|uniref:Uncharacterized protein n=1 Tax=Cryptococcus wingfieldii CBS 7118 TaxID=1295528 RepID=A0A1E3K348_9TREE|nr:hypothetical protein L198_01030 [Cryptococcus wingfieldii CBS 7118]ODO07451.1 hypothetical protein L198_01030 [Cryptococcus wingfieldii CBS 7118]